MIGRRRGRGGGGFFDRDPSTIGFPALQMRVIAQVRRPPPPFPLLDFSMVLFEKKAACDQIKFTSGQFSRHLANLAPLHLGPLPLRIFFCPPPPPPDK